MTERLFNKIVNASSIEEGLRFLFEDIERAETERKQRKLATMRRELRRSIVLEEQRFTVLAIELLDSDSELHNKLRECGFVARLEMREMSKRVRASVLLRNDGSHGVINFRKK
jgi:hypothetical protein